MIDWNNGLERRRKSSAERLRVDPLEHIARSGKGCPIQRNIGLYQAVTANNFEDQLFSGLRDYRERKASNIPHSYTDMPRDVERAARLRAACLFHAFMEAPWRHKLGKCKRCHSYFVLRNKPAETYVRGMHCSDCKNIASAGASAKTKRAERESRLLGLVPRLVLLASPDQRSQRVDRRTGERLVW